MPVIRLYATPYSTNVERVALALGHKGMDAELVMLDPDDRSRVRELSGQDLVPVIEDEGRVVTDSPVILEYLEERRPEPRMFPAEPARDAEMRIFIDWFNRVWKRAPNAMAAAIEAGAPDPALIDELSAEMAGALGWFESLLDRREFLFGDGPSAADFVVFPFLKYAARIDEGDDEVFHRVLHEHQPLGDEHPRLRAWIDRVDALPRTPAI